MKTILMMTMMVVSLSAFARPGDGGFDPRRGGFGRDHGRGGMDRGGMDRGGMDRGGYGNLSCRATDNGWEEHWGGHSDCRSCVAVHGNCTERCSREEYVCEAQGQRFGRQETYRATDSSRFQAEDRALRDCRMSRAERCTIKSCNTRSEVVSTRSCR